MNVNVTTDESQIRGFSVSHRLYEAACKAAVRAKKDDQRADSLWAIIGSAVAIEAAVRDIRYLTEAHLERLGSSFKSEDEVRKARSFLELRKIGGSRFDDHVALKDTITLTALLFTGEPPCWGNDPLQSLNELVSLRNFFIHITPEMHVFRGGVHEKMPAANIIEWLTSRKVLVRPSPPTPDDAQAAFEILQDPSVAIWCCNTALSALNWFVEITKSTAAEEENRLLLEQGKSIGANYSRPSIAYYHGYFGQFPRMVSWMWTGARASAGLAVSDLR